MSQGREPLKDVVIVGGGTAGWIAAAALSKILGQRLNITLIESDSIGTVGVGEATIPQIRRLNAVLGIDENDVLQKIQGTFKLGIQFNNWGQVGESYLHTFGDTGINLSGVHFHHYWLRARGSNQATDFWDYSLHEAAAYSNKFGRLDRVGNTTMTGLAYAFHFDASLYAAYLRRIAEVNGVKRVEGIVSDVALCGETGNISKLTLDDGSQISGELFVDCTGFRALLIGQALGVGYEDWSHWLPVNRALAVGSKRLNPLPPYTSATAHEAGWQWRIPLQHRTGNGHVFCDQFTSEEDALDQLVSTLNSKPLGEPKRLFFRTGRRQVFWKRNCLALGLASGFMEPLESTSIHLVQSHIDHLISLFPQFGISEADIDAYNTRVGIEMERIRDFLILHYKLTQRDDSEFWRYVQDMEVPETLTDRIRLFSDNARVFKDPNDLFKETSWVQVMMGQGLTPKGYSVLADRISDDQLVEFMSNTRDIVRSTASQLPLHSDFIQRNCAADAHEFTA